MCSLVIKDSDMLTIIEGVWFHDAWRGIVFVIRFAQFPNETMFAMPAMGRPTMPATVTMWVGAKYLRF